MTMTATTRTVSAFFDTREAASNAVDELVKAGFPRASLSLVEGSKQPGASTADHDGGFWEALKDFFFPEEDRYTYTEGLRRGGYLVTARTADANYQRALQILDREGAVDIDQRAQSWRSEGWTGYTGGRMAGASTVQTPTLSSTGMTSAREQVVPVVEEELKVGKRETGHGLVRVRSYVVEKPVREQVSLTEEHVHVERRPVDRPLSTGEGTFQERTIVAEEKREEAVVSKRARVKEEVVLKKDTQQRTETVSDTVRRTEVKVEDERGNAVPPDRRRVG